MNRIVSMGDRKFMVIRQCRSEFLSEQARISIRDSNSLIDIVLDDGRGNMLFCHEIKDAQFRDLVREGSSTEQEQTSSE